MGKLYILIEVCPPHRGLTPRSLKMGDTKMQHAKMSHDEAKRLDEIVTGLRTKRVKDIMPTEDITLVANTYRVPKRILGRTVDGIVYQPRTETGVMVGGLAEVVEIFHAVHNAAEASGNTGNQAYWQHQYNITQDIAAGKEYSFSLASITPEEPSIAPKGK